MRISPLSGFTNGRLKPSQNLHSLINSLGEKIVNLEKLAPALDGDESLKVAALIAETKKALAKAQNELSCKLRAPGD